MNYQILGRDEQGKAPVFVRLVDPTDLQQVAWKMCRIIKDRLSWDWINLQAWRMLGLECGPVEDFVERYILIARQFRHELTPSTREEYKVEMVSRYDYPPQDADIFIDAFLEVKDAGLVPASIGKPWDYEATTISEDVGRTVMTKAVPIIAVVGLAALAIWGLTTRALPKVAARGTGF